MGLPPTAGSGLSGCESRALGVDGKGSSAGLSLGTRDGFPANRIYRRFGITGKGQAWGCSPRGKVESLPHQEA